MARIPESDIKRLKQEVSLQRLVEAQGIKLKRHGADLLKGNGGRRILFETAGFQRRVSESNQVALLLEALWSVNFYDAMGRALLAPQTTGGKPYSVSQLYRAGGMVRTVTVPSGRAISYDYGRGSDTEWGSGFDHARKRSD